MIENLWKETIAYLHNYNKTWEDVIGVCGYHLQITKDDFKELANQTNYDSGYGIAHIPTDLNIVGNGWWLERSEYDGSESWSYKEIPNVKELPLGKVNTLYGNYCYLKDFIQK